MKGEEHILVNFPIDTSLKKKAHSALSNHENLLSNHENLLLNHENDGRCRQQGRLHFVAVFS